MLNTPFDNPIVPTPGGQASGGAARTGGTDIPQSGQSGSLQTPYDTAFVPQVGQGQGETPNSASGLPLRVDQPSVEGAPAPGASVGYPSADRTPMGSITSGD